MEEIRLFVEHLLELMGLHGTWLVVMRHVLLVLVALVLSSLSGILCRKILVPLVLRVSAKTNTKWDDVLFDRPVLNTACSIVPAIVVSWLLPLVFYQFPLVEEALSRITSVYITVNSVRLAVGIIGRVRYLDIHTSGTAAHQYLNSFCIVLRVAIIFIGVVVGVALLLGKNPLTLFAGLGATSAILMLVFKDVISGLVAGIRLTSNEMLLVGDWITVPGTQVNGVVIEMTLTTVKVRQFDNSVATVSPLTLVSGSFQNWRAMQQSEGRRMQKRIYFDFRSVRLCGDELKQRLLGRGYATEDDLRGDVVNMGVFRKYVERYLRGRDDVNTDLTLFVRQLEATQSGMPVEVYCFLRKKEWVAYEHAVADILEHIYAYAHEFGLVVYEQYPEQ